MTDARDRDEVRRRAGTFTDVPALLGEPLEVRDPQGVRSGWFVPMVDDDVILGFVELTADLQHRRTSRFGSGRDDAPSAESWLDPEVVVARARSELDDGEVAGEPWLSWDTVPDRLAWAVPVGGPHGPRIVHVAGDAAWSGPASTGLG